MLTKRNLLFIILVLVLALTVYAQTNVSVEEIMNNPEKYLKSSVIVKGSVPQWNLGDGENSQFYILKSSYGGIIRVNTLGSLPELNKNYSVTGIVYRDDRSREIFISEKSRTQILSSGIIILIIAIILASIGIIIFFIKKHNIRISVKTGTPSVDDLNSTLSSPVVPSQPVASQPVSAQPIPTAAPKTTRIDNSFHTISIKTSPKTVKFIPGRLEIISGEDTGKFFKISGMPGLNGSVVTIGREDVKGDAAYYHIKLDDRFMTVSRKQAEFIYKDGQLFVKNLSATNLTEVDDKSLFEGQIAEVNSGATISMGEVKFKYIL